MKVACAPSRTSSLLARSRMTLYAVHLNERGADHEVEAGRHTRRDRQISRCLPGFQHRVECAAVAQNVVGRYRLLGDGKHPVVERPVLAELPGEVEAGLPDQRIKIVPGQRLRPDPVPEAAADERMDDRDRRRPIQKEPAGLEAVPVLPARHLRRQRRQSARRFQVPVDPLETQDQPLLLVEADRACPVQLLFQQRGIEVGVEGDPTPEVVPPGPRDFLLQFVRGMRNDRADQVRLHPEPLLLTWHQLPQSVERRLPARVERIPHAAGTGRPLPPAARRKEDDDLRLPAEMLGVLGQRARFPADSGPHAAPRAPSSAAGATGPPPFQPASSRIMRDAFSAIMIVGELVLPLTIVGMTEASAMRSLPRARNLSRGSTTASSSAPMRQVPTGWKIVVPMSPAARRRSASVCKRRAGTVLLRVEARECRLRRDAPGQPDRPRGHLAVRLRRQVVRPDRRGRRSRAASHAPATALGPQVADGGRHRREGVHRLAEPVEADRLDVVLQVRRFLIAARSG